MAEDELENNIDKVMIAKSHVFADILNGMPPKA
jgi:hypothetical protein